MARTYQSEGWYKFPPLWSAGTEVSCRGQFRIAAMSVTAVLESRVLNSRPVTLLYTYLPCPPHHLPFSPSLSATLPLSLLPSLSSRFPDRFIFSPRSFQYTYIYIYMYIHTYTWREVRFFSKGARIGLSSNRTRQSVITKRAHESLVYSLTVKTKYLSVNSVFSFSSELNVALPRSIQTFLDIYFYDYFVYFSNSVRVRACVCTYTNAVFVEKNKEGVLRQSEHEVHAGELFNRPITRKAWPIETSIRRVSNHVSIFSCTPLSLSCLLLVR